MSTLDSLMPPAFTAIYQGAAGSLFKTKQVYSSWAGGKTRFVKNVQKCSTCLISQGGCYGYLLPNCCSTWCSSQKTKQSIKAHEFPNQRSPVQGIPFNIQVQSKINVLLHHWFKRTWSMDAYWLNTRWNLLIKCCHRENVGISTHNHLLSLWQTRSSFCQKTCLFVLSMRRINKFFLSLIYVDKYPQNTLSVLSFNSRTFYFRKLHFLFLKLILLLGTICVVLILYSHWISISKYFFLHQFYLKEEMPTLGKVPKIVWSPIYDAYDRVMPNFRFYFICFKKSVCPEIRKNEGHARLDFF